MSPQWNVLPSPGQQPARPGPGRGHRDAEAERTLPAPLLRLTDGSIACTECGALIAPAFTEKHAALHRTAGDRRPALPRVTVHGMTSPATEGLPWRVVDVDSAYPVDQTIMLLREHVQGLRADLGLHHPNGFRATLRPGWRPGAESLPVRIAFDVTAHSEGSAVRVLMISGMDMFSDGTPSTSGAYSYADRFDLLEAGLVRLLGRR